MRIVGIIFFVLLGLQIVLRYLRPPPAPAWSRVAVIACCVGMIACLLIQAVAERGRGEDDDQTPSVQ